MKTRHLALCACAFVLGLAATDSHAVAPGTLAAREYTTYAVGADLIGQLPVGDFADVAGFGLGALLRAEYNINRGPLAVTARAGYIWHVPTETAPSTFRYSQVPLLAGLKYSLPGAPVYIGAEAGAVIGMSEVETDPPGPAASFTDSDSETNFAWSAGAGYEMGPVDIRLALYFPDASNMAEMMAVGISLGYNFGGK